MINDCRLCKYATQAHLSDRSPAPRRRPLAACKKECDSIKNYDERQAGRVRRTTCRYSALLRVSRFVSEVAFVTQWQAGKGVPHLCVISMSVQNARVVC